MADSEAVFQEVVQMSLGYDQFTADLQKIEDAWDAALQRMNDSAQSAGIDPSQLLNSGAFSADLDQLQQQIQGLADSMGNAFGAVATTLTDTMDRVEQATSRATSSLENLNNTKSRIAGVGTIGTPVGTEEAQTTREFERNFQNRLAAAKVLEEELARIRAADSAANKAADDETTAEFDRAYQIRAEVSKKVEAEIARLHAETQAELKAADTESTDEFVRSYQIRQEVAAKLGAELRGLAEEQAVANRGFFENFMVGLQGSDSFGEMLGSVARFSVMWGAVGAIINGIVETLKAIPSAIASGIEYAQQLQDKTADIQGVIAANITYTKDWADNFRIAGDEAQQVVKALQDAAIKDALNPDQLQKAFKALLQGGGGEFATNMNQLVQLTTMFGLAMKAAGKDAESTRSLIAEIPKLLEGTVTDSSKLLEVLHLNKQEWEQIRQSALQHHDLLAKLEPVMKPYLSVVEQAELRQNVLKEQIGLIFQRIEAEGSKPFFEVWTATLTMVKQLLQENQQQIVGILAAFSQAGVSLLQMVEHLGDSKTLMTAIYTTLALIVVGFSNMFSIIGQIVGDLGSVLDLLFHIVEQFRHPFDMSGWKSAFDSFIQHVKSNWKETYDTFVKGNDILDTMAGKTLVPGGLPAEGNIPESELNGAQRRPSLLDRNYESARGPRDVGNQKEELAALKAEYQRAAEEVKSDTQAVIDGIRQQISANAITVEDGEKKIIEALKGEDTLLADLSDRYEQKAQAFGKAGEKITNQIATEFQKTDAEIGKQQDAAGNAIVAHQVKLAQEITAETIKEAQTRSQGELQAVKDAVAQGLMLKSEAAAKELSITKDLHNQKMQLLALEMSKYAEGTDAYIKLSRQMSAESENYYNKVIHLSQQRTAALEQEERTDMQLRKEGLQVALQEAEAEAGIIPHRLQNANAIYAANQKILDIKRQLLDLAVQDAARQLAEAAAVGKTTQEVQKLTDALHQAEAARRAAFNQQVQSAGQNAVNATGTQSIANAAELAEKQKILADLQKEHEELQKLYVAYVELARVLPNSSAALKDLQAAMKENEKEQADVTISMQENKLSWDMVKDGLDKVAPVLDLYKVWHEKNVDAMTKFNQSLELLSRTITNIGGMVQNIMGAFQNGGALGGAGAIAGTVGGIFQDIGGSLGPWGIGLSAVGSVLGFVSGLFDAAAKRIAKEISASIQQINQQAQEGAINLATQIQELQQQRQDAINRLSGEKGGSDQLKKILDQLDPEIAQLQNQQKQILQNFQNQVAIMKQTGDAAQQWLQNWMDINNQVKQYLGAGGNPNIAHEFLEEKLAQMKQQITDQYNQNEEQAIQDSFQLNNLLQQRKDLLLQIQQLGQGVQDSIERREAGSILSIRNNALQKQQLQQQLDDLNAQINVQTVKVQKEQQLFGLTMDINQLHRVDEQLQIQALNEQMTQWQALANLIKSVSGPFGLSPSGYFYGGNPFAGVPGGIPGFGATASAPAIHINGPIYINGKYDSFDAGRDFGRGLYDEWSYRYRQGFA